jgi:membrane protease YdiL (CAAX protease family)
MSDAVPSATYWHETRRPWVNLVFLAPWLAVYECGVWLSEGQGHAARNGADVWLRSAFDRTGWTLAWLLPFVVLGTLWVWHRGTQQPCRVSLDTLAGMCAESVLFACGLIVLGQTADLCLRAQALAPLSVEIPETALRFVNFLGAGLYEEYLFRLCLLPLAYWLLRALLLPQRAATAGAVLLTSAVFALAHYLTPSGEGTLLSLFSDAVVRVQSQRELWFGFTFRLLAGAYFAAIYCTRGFGIAVGCHAVYDVIVGIVLISKL